MRQLLLVLFAFAALASTARAADTPDWPTLSIGQAYATAPNVATPTPAPSGTRAPLTNSKGVTVVFFAPGSEGIEAFLDDSSSSPMFAKSWNELLNSGLMVRFHWWKFSGAHNGAYAVFDPQRRLADVGIDPNDASGKPYAPGALESNITRGFFLVYADWQMYKYFNQ